MHDFKREYCLVIMRRGGGLIMLVQCKVSNKLISFNPLSLPVVLDPSLRGDAQSREEEEEEEERGLQTCPPLSSPCHRYLDRHCSWPIAPKPDHLPPSPCARPTPAVSSPALPEPIRDWV